MPDLYFEYDDELIVNKIRITTLNRMGYVNLDHIREPDHSFGYKDRHTPGARWREVKAFESLPLQLPPANDTISPERYIHPIFFKERWTGEMRDPTTGWWDRLKPVWQLATVLLEEPQLCGYTIGMLDTSQHRRIDDGLLREKKLEGERYEFEAKKNPTTAETNGLWADLWSLKDCITWRPYQFSGDDADAFAETRATPNTQGITPQGTASQIFISMHCFDVLCRDAVVDDPLYQWVPGTDQETARLRAGFLLGYTLVHELHHALWRAKFPYGTPEPYYRGERVSEVGWQWSKMAFAGAIMPMTSTHWFAFGLKITRWPFPNDPQGFGEVLSDYKNWPGGHRWVTTYAVKMDWVQSFFTHKRWRNVDRFGLETLQPKRLLGVRVRLKDAPDGEPFRPRSPDDANDRNIVLRDDSFALSYLAPW